MIPAGGSGFPVPDSGSRLGAGFGRELVTGGPGWQFGVVHEPPEPGGREVSHLRCLRGRS